MKPKKPKGTVIGRSDRDAAFPLGTGMRGWVFAGFVGRIVDWACANCGNLESTMSTDQVPALCECCDAND